jgi:hypothetical protein
MEHLSEIDDYNDFLKSLGISDLDAVKMMDENKKLTFYEAIPLSYSLEKQKLNNNGRPETNI